MIHYDLFFFCFLGSGGKIRLQEEEKEGGVFLNGGHVLIQNVQNVTLGRGLIVES